ncbi:hypothetical protein VTK73DRAFT_1761 [Phialemonium thermophilum]|uniref:Uncharacterized protein n=1 Tax=Phialemonium thermophilum TaxID=223376 RepID=A0ABR3VSZ7_9PEZI
MKMRPPPGAARRDGHWRGCRRPSRVSLRPSRDGWQRDPLNTTNLGLQRRKQPSAATGRGGANRTGPMMHGQSEGGGSSAGSCRPDRLEFHSTTPSGFFHPGIASLTIPGFMRAVGVQPRSVRLVASSNET